jgi:hypothetical protein
MKKKNYTLDKEEKITNACLHLLLIGCIGLFIMSIIVVIFMIYTTIFS